MTAVRISSGEDVDWVANPDLMLEDVRSAYRANRCSGRGSSTAAARGYNIERLATAVFDVDGFFMRYPGDKTCIDTTGFSDNHHEVNIESKGAVNRYPSGGYGEFRIWWSNHVDLFIESIDYSPKRYIYFFVTYAVDGNGYAKEVGKLSVDVEIMDDLLTNWRWVDHTSMSKARVRDISWHLLLSRLGVSVDRFRETNMIVVTSESS